ncbi:MAG: hypothetical protein ACJAS1_000490 [Oleiphilaceae bacterium]|jgi:uncharacterized protein YjfI (DUF2170 family)
MKAKSSAHYQREYRSRLREQGFVKKEVWILPVNAKLLAACEKRLRLHGIGRSMVDEIESGVIAMTANKSGVSAWTTTSLLEALRDEELFVSGAASLELIDGLGSTIHIEMKEYGDLPIFVTVSGEQIIVEAVLWSLDEVSDVAAFNDAILRTHKFFSLSTISLDKVGDEGDYYHMFGALSSTSLLSNVVFEIEILASNVIQSTEAYSEFLSIPVATSK